MITKHKNQRIGMSYALISSIIFLGLLAGGDAKATCWAQQYNQSQCTSNNSQTTPANNNNYDWNYCQNPASQVPDGETCQWTNNNGWGGYCYPNCISPSSSKSRSTLRRGL